MSFFSYKVVQYNLIRFDGTLARYLWWHRMGSIKLCPDSCGLCASSAVHNGPIAYAVPEVRSGASSHLKLWRSYQGHLRESAERHRFTSDLKRCNCELSHIHSFEWRVRAARDAVKGGRIFIVLSGKQTTLTRIRQTPWRRQSAEAKKWRETSPIVCDLLLAARATFFYRSLAVGIGISIFHRRNCFVSSALSRKTDIYVDFLCVYHINTTGWFCDSRPPFCPKSSLPPASVAILRSPWETV